jgi:hypothetical protein
MRITLKKLDSALVCREDGQVELVFPKPKDDDEVPANLVALAAVAMAIQCEDQKCPLNLKLVELVEIAFQGAKGSKE